jgi:putative Holliday junction resolvase
MKTLGIDFGTKKTGIAISDEMGKVAFPYAVLPSKELVDAVAEICKKENISTIVLGESRDFSGAPNPIMEKISTFGKEIVGKTELPVFYEPEFLTSKQARNILDSGELNDASAAAIILQSYLDRQISS